MGYEFFMPLELIPTSTAQQKRVKQLKNGKVIFYEDEDLRNARETFMSELVRHKIKNLTIGGAVELIVTWCFPEDVKNGKIHGLPMLDKPDLDNLHKLFNDCLVKHEFIEDDRRIFRLIAEKFHSKVVGIRVVIREIKF